jgi:MFS-type transporter involved in bile tolerance (Atg22 family)
VSAVWNGVFNYANSIGGVLGALFAGWVYDHFGPKVTLTACSFLSIIFIFMEFFTETLVVLFLGELFNGCVIAFYPSPPLADCAGPRSEIGERCFAIGRRGRLAFLIS